METRKKYFLMMIISIIILPILIPLFMIGLHSNELIIKPIHYLSFLLLFLTLVFFITITILYLKKKEEKKEKQKKSMKQIILIILIFLEWIGSTSFLILLYGPIPNFRNWLIPTAMTTMNHQYFAKWFYSKEEIDKVLEQNQLIEIDETTDLNLIKIGENENTTIYESEYDKEILTKDSDNENYKIIRVEGKGYKGYLVAIYDPAKVKVATTKYLNVKGQYVTDMASDNQAILAINGGGFDDPEFSSNGGTPGGIVIQNGKVVFNQTSGKSTGGLIGFTKDNKLILGKMTAQEAIKKGVRDAVSFGPFLIVNGKKSFMKGNGGWGSAPRSAIGQRKDGIVLFLVVDGRQLTMPGADMVDLTEIMANYGAYNAANLDGGTSSVIVFPEHVAQKYLKEAEMKTHCRNKYCYINDPIDGGGDHATRWIPTSFIVK